MEYIPDGLTKAQWESLKKKVNIITLFLFLYAFMTCLYA